MENNNEREVRISIAIVSGKITGLQISGPYEDNDIEKVKFLLDSLKTVISVEKETKKEIKEKIEKKVKEEKNISKEEIETSQKKIYPDIKKRKGTAMKRFPSIKKITKEIEDDIIGMMREGASDSHIARVLCKEKGEKFITQTTISKFHRDLIERNILPPTTTPRNLSHNKEQKEGEQHA